MISEKPFLTYAQQLDKLENEKNLIVNDKVHAEAILKRLSYFALISGYKKLFRNPTTQKYKDNTTFEDIVALYKFDESLRILFLKHLLQIEQAIRSMMSYYFTQKYGESQSEYLNKMNFNQTPRKQVTLTKLINILQNIAVNSTDYPYVSYQRESYGNVPLWVLVKVLTFGNISKMYQCVTQDLQVKVSKNYVSVNEKELIQYLKVLTKFRNVCAHGDRLFTFTTKD
ncbi:MAG: Abi family protein, partial [Oscillospiraceae bacterium]|nr:Abi family protein [Oscillospiraceae bacterium]